MVTANCDGDKKCKKCQKGEDAEALATNTDTRNVAMNRNQKTAWWRQLGESLGVLNAKPKQGRHSQTGKFHEHAGTAAQRGHSDLTSGYDDTEPRGMGRHKVSSGDDGRDTMRGQRVDIDLDGDHDGPVDDYWLKNEDEAAEQTQVPPNQPSNQGTNDGGELREGAGESEGRSKKTLNAEQCPKCGGDMDEDGECEECGYVENAQHPVPDDEDEEECEDDDMPARNSNPEGHNQYTGGSFNLKGHKGTFYHTGKNYTNGGGEYERHVDGEPTGHLVDVDAKGNVTDKSGNNEHLGSLKKPARNAGGFANGQVTTPTAPPAVAPEQAHAASTSAAQASMTTPEARGPAIKALDQSKAGKSNFAAKNHGAAADAHDDAAAESTSQGNSDDADQHHNAAMLHRKAAALHGVMASNKRTPMQNNAFDEVMKLPFVDLTTNQGRTRFSKFVSHVVANGAMAAAEGAKAAGYPEAQAAAMAGKLDGSYEGTGSSKSQAAHSASRAAEKKGTKGAHKAAAVAHRAAAKAHTSEGNSKSATKHGDMAKGHEKMASKLSRNESIINELVANGYLNQADMGSAMSVLNAKTPGSNSDEQGDGSFDAAVQAGGEEDDTDNDTTGYKSDSGKGLDYDDTRKDAQDDPIDTGGGGEEVRGRVGNSAMTPVEMDQFSQSAFGLPSTTVREVLRNAAAQEQHTRRKLIAHLLSDVPGQHRRHVFNAMELGSKNARQLQVMLLLKPQRTVENDDYTETEVVDNQFRNGGANYLGQGFLPPIGNHQEEPVGNASDDVSCMVPEVSGNVLNFKQMQDEERRQRVG